MLGIFLFHLLNFVMAETIIEVELIIILTELAIKTFKVFSLLFLAHCLADMSKFGEGKGVLHEKFFLDLILFLHLLLHLGLDNPEQSHLPPAPFLITHLLGRLEWFHPSQITSPPPSPPGTTSKSITFLIHPLFMILI